MFDMTFFAPRCYHAAFARLGKLPWFTVTAVEFDADQPGIAFGVDYPVIAAHDPDLARLLARIHNDQPEELYGLAALVSCLTHGPKLLRPRLETCRMLADVKIPLTLSDYTQPYETVIIRFPPEWLAEITDGRMPPHAHVMMYQSPCRTFVVMRIGVHGAEIPDGAFMFCNKTGRTVETMVGEMLATYARDVSLGARSSRPWSTSWPRIMHAAMNLCLLATYSGTKSAGWLDPKAHAKHVKLARKDQRGRDLLAGDVEEVVFDQEVALKLGVRFAARPEPGDGTHASPHPHPRRRHMRWARVGPGRSGLRLVPVKETFVRRAALLASGHDEGDVGSDRDVE